MEHIFIAKILIFINFPQLKFVDMVPLDEFLDQKTKENYFAIHLMTYPENLTVRKLMKMRIFTIKIYYISS